MNRSKRNDGKNIEEDSSEASDESSDEYILSESEEEEASIFMPYKTVESPFQLKVLTKTYSSDPSQTLSPTLVIEKEEPIASSYLRSEHRHHGMRRVVTRNYAKDITTLLGTRMAQGLLQQSTLSDSQKTTSSPNFVTPVRRVRKVSSRNSSASSSSSNKDSSVAAMMDYLKFFITKTSSLNDEQEETFLSRYLEFMYENIPLSFPNPFPKWRSIPLDMFRLFVQVKKNGGYSSMEMSDWNDVYSFMRNYCSIVKNPGGRLKILYQYYLLEFEKSGFDIETLHETADSLKKFRQESEELQKRIITFIKKKSVNELPESCVDHSCNTPLDETPKKQEQQASRKISKHVDSSDAYLIFFKQNNSTSFVIKTEIYNNAVGNALLKVEPIVMGPILSCGQSLWMDLENDEFPSNFSQQTTHILEKGTLAYSENQSSIVFGFGATPKSENGECRLTDPCIVFGRINDSKYTFDEDDQSATYLPQALSIIGNDSEVWCAKLCLNIPLEFSGTLSQQRKKMKTSEGSNDEYSSDHSKLVESPQRVFTMRYRYEGETEVDARLITKKYSGMGSQIDLREILSLLRRDNVNVDMVSEIRYFKEGKDVDHCGWVILPPSMAISLIAPETMLKLLLKRKTN